MIDNILSYFSQLLGGNDLSDIPTYVINSIQSLYQNGQYELVLKYTNPLVWGSVALVLLVIYSFFRLLHSLFFRR